MNDFTPLLEAEFKRNGDATIAAGQKAYMRNQFAFIGIKTPLRRTIQQPFLAKQYLPSKAEASTIVKALWKKPEREFQLFGQELIYKYHKDFEEKDMALFEYMVANKSWWDTVDFIAVNIMGQYFKKFPELRKKYVKKWLTSNNIWLQRSAILFQLKYKTAVDTELLKSTINSLLGSNEFFINKAIGWMLRHYSRTNPQWVQNFCANTELQPLSRREALRLMN